MAQFHETPDNADVRKLMHVVRKEKDDDLKGKLEELKASLPVRIQRVIPLKNINFDLSKGFVTH